MAISRFIIPSSALSGCLLCTGMVADRIHKTLDAKSKMHQIELKRLGKVAEDLPLSKNVIVLPEKNQVRGINNIMFDQELDREEFVFFFDRLATMLVERYVAETLCMRYSLTCYSAADVISYKSTTVETPQNEEYHGLKPSGETSAVVILRGGSILETGLKRVIPDCRTGRVLIQTSWRTGEPELHYYKLSEDVSTHEQVLLLDSQMSSGGAALMAVRVLLDHGVPEDRIVFVTYMAGKIGLNRLMSVFPDIKVVVCRIVDDLEIRWVEKRYLGC